MIKSLIFFCSKFASLVVDSVLKAPYVKGAKEFLENYALGYKCFVVSATPQKEIEEIIEKRNMSQFFEGIYGTPTEKSEVVRNILLAGEIPSTNALYIGDAMSDYIAARIIM